MADKKISALTASTVPLAGTEVLPIVQSGATVKVAVSDLTAGRAVAMLTANVGDASSQNGVFDAVVGSASATTGDNTGLVVVSNSTGKGWLGFNNANNSSIPGQVTYDHSTGQMGFRATGNYFFDLGNLVIGTSGKGIDFSATPGTGTSELLADYEEGDWTPTQGAGLTVVGTFTSSGKYTKIGRTVTITGKVSGSTSVALNQDSNLCGGLPFAQQVSDPLAIGGALQGNVVNQTLIYVYSSSLYSGTALAASATIYFSATYFV